MIIYELNERGFYRLRIGWIAEIIIIYTIKLMINNIIVFYQNNENKLNIIMAVSLNR